MVLTSIVNDADFAEWMRERDQKPLRVVFIKREREIKQEFPVKDEMISPAG